MDKNLKQNFSDEITFKFLSDSALKAFEKDGKKYCRLTASSNGEDLVGDIMSEKALSRMKEAAVGTVMFMNHSTNVPEDVFGTVVETELEKKQAALVGGGAGDVLCLEYLTEVEESNERAVKCWQMMKSGTKLGASVTVLVREKKSNPKRNKGIIIDDVEYLETSIVGIPCNRQSWVNSAQKSLELAEKRAVKNADEPLKNEGEINQMEIEKAVETEVIEEVTETVEKTVETLNEQLDSLTDANIVVVGASGVGTGAVVLARSIAARERVVILNQQIAKGETTEERPMPVVKGMFNDILEQEPTFWELCDILCEVKWELIYQKNRLAYLGQTDFSSILANWDEALDEFKIAQTSSFKYWGEIPDVEDDLLEMSLEIEKSLTNLLEEKEKTSNEDVQKQLHETGERIIALAIEKGLIKDSAPETTEQIPTDEAVQKSAVYQELKSKSEDQETELKETKKKLEETEQNFQIAKAGLTAANEALEKGLRQPLVTAQGTSATS